MMMDPYLTPPHIGLQCNGFSGVRTQFFVEMERTPVYFHFNYTILKTHEQKDNGSLFNPSVFWFYDALSGSQRASSSSLSQTLTERQAGT